MSESIYQSNGQPAAAPNDLLLYLAKKNVAQKRSMIKHVILYATAWLTFAVVSGVRIFLDGASAIAPSVSPITLAILQNNNFQPYTRILPGPRGGNVAWGSPDAIYGFWSSVDGFAFSEAHHTGVDFFARIDSYAQGNPWWWFFVLGILAAWGVWVAMSMYKVISQHRQTRGTKAPKPPKPDPVALEYQRLMQKHESETIED